MVRCLIISDETKSRSVLRKLIIECGHSCDLASSDADIMTTVIAGMYDLIFCDVRLRSTSGFDLIKSILEKVVHLNAIMVVNEDTLALSEMIFKTGALDFIPLPVDPHRVRITLSNALHRHQTEKETQGEQREADHSTDVHTETTTTDGPILQQVSQALERAQKQILNSEKMAAIGQLAAGVAHEINNPVGFVASNLNTLAHYQRSLMAITIQYRKLLSEVTTTLEETEHQPAVAKRSARIKRLEAAFDMDFLCRDMRVLISESLVGISRVKKIVRDLKAFVHPGQDTPELVDIHKQLDATLNLVWNKLKYKVTVQKEYGRIPFVRCWAGQLNQVFLNLIVNAVQSIPAKGRLTIKTRIHKKDQVEIIISDTGTGIASEHLDKIFEPFFTTKPVGQGTGLGLSMSAEIIKKHNGTVTVDSKVGEGSTFKIQLPLNLEKADN